MIMIIMIIITTIIKRKKKIQKMLYSVFFLRIGEIKNSKKKKKAYNTQIIAATKNCAHTH